MVPIRLPTKDIEGGEMDTPNLASAQWSTMVPSYRAGLRGDDRREKSPDQHLPFSCRSGLSLHLMQANSLTVSAFYTLPRASRWTGLSS